MSVAVKELSEQQNKLIHDARSLQDRADAEKRDMNPDETKQFNAMMDKVDELSKKVDALGDAGGEEENDDDPEAGAEKPDGDRDDKPADDEKEVNKLRRMLLESNERNIKRSAGTVSKRHFNRDLSGNYAGNDGAELRANGSKRYAKAFRHYLLTAQMPHEFRDMTLGTNTSGGYLVTPTKLSDDIVKMLNNLVFIRQMAQIDRLTDAVSLGNPQLTADVSGIAWSGETAAATPDTSLTLGRRDLTPNLAAKLVKASYRLLQASPRAEALIAERIALAYSYGEETAYLTGSGSGQPLGLFTPSASGVPSSQDVTASGGSHNFVADDLFDVLYSLPQQYTNGDTFGWIMHRQYVRQTVLLKDSNNQYLWNVSGYLSPLSGKRCPTLCGYPVWMSEFAPYNATPATGQYIAILGDYKFYRIAETMDMEIQRLVELFATSNELGFMARKFVDGSPVLPNAFARLITP